MMRSHALESYRPPGPALANRPAWPRAVRPSPEADALFEAALTEAETRRLRDDARDVVERWSRVLWRRWAAARYLATFPAARL